ncbi:MAG: CoA transferase, partial [Actinobacteria bacterium]
ADIFLINFLPDARRRLHLEVDDIRAANPNIIYVRGSGHGQRGPDAEKGGYDGSTFWCRMGSAWGATPSDSSRVSPMPAGAYGDSMGAMTIAGGIAAALFARDRTGEPSVVDVSLMSVGAWAIALSLGNAMLTNEVITPASLSAPMNLAVHVGWPLDQLQHAATRPLLRRRVQAPGLEYLLEDERFTTAEGLMANALEAGRHIAAVIAEKPYSYWVEHLQTMEGQWAPIQDPLEIAADPQMEANGYIVPLVDADGKPRRLVANPVQFDETPPTITRGPLFAEHTDEILRELGKSDDEIIELKIAGACT